MNNTSIKIFIYFTLVSTVIAVILLFINFMGYAYIESDTDGEKLPRKTLALISEKLIETDSGFELNEDVLPSGYWCILIDENGNIVWSQNKPDDIPESYSLNDIARMTRWFLNDYPVYVSTEDYGLLVVGMPKNAVGKYHMVYSQKWFETLPQRIIIILFINLCFAAVLAFLFGIKLYRRLRALTNGISDLRYERPVRLKERGIFKEISANINRTSEAMERKNEKLSARDNARANWIAGISHDIRTPLSVIIGKSEEISHSDSLDEGAKKKASVITAQGMKIKKLIEDMNIISSLEYDMQPSDKKAIKICPILRRTVTDIINSGIADKCNIELELKDEKSTVTADEALIERAIYNIINNSIRHNKNGCKIKITQRAKAEATVLEIADNGRGIPEEAIKNIAKMPCSAHGMGLPMAYRIIKAHGGNFEIKNDSGAKIKIELY